MPDKSQHLILGALMRAMAEPAGVPLFAGKSGLFPANAAGKQAAQLCKDHGWLRPLRTETRAKNTIDICAISEQGLAYLLEQANPREVLEELVRSLDARRQQFDDILAATRAGRQALDDLASTVKQVVERLHKPCLPAKVDCNGHAPPGDRSGVLLERLRTWHHADTLDDCPLPRLYDDCKQPGWSIGQFHDSLRVLHRDQKIYLHPWTGPLYEVPEPAFALLIGHEIAYYASLRA